MFNVLLPPSDHHIPDLRLRTYPVQVLSSRILNFMQACMSTMTNTCTSIVKYYFQDREMPRVTRGQWCRFVYSVYRISPNKTSYATCAFILNLVHSHRIFIKTGPLDIANGVLRCIYHAQSLCSLACSAVTL